MRVNGNPLSGGQRKSRERPDREVRAGARKELQRRARDGTYNATYRITGSPASGLLRTPSLANLFPVLNEPLHCDDGAGRIDTAAVEFSCRSLKGEHLDPDILTLFRQTEDTAGLARVDPASVQMDLLRSRSRTDQKLTDGPQFQDLAPGFFQ